MSGSELSPPEKLSPEHDLSGFDCGEPALARIVGIAGALLAGLRGQVCATNPRVARAASLDGRMGLLRPGVENETNGVTVILARRYEARLQKESEELQA